MEILIVFSTPHVPRERSLQTALHLLEEHEQMIRRMVFDKIIVIDQGNMPYPKDIESLFKRAKLVKEKEFSTEPYANYTVCAEGAESYVAFKIAHKLRHATNGWVVYEDMQYLLNQRFRILHTI
jgi:hypothetical protein